MVVRFQSKTAYGFAAVVAASAIVYWLTAYPTITWWDSSSLSLAAVTLGIGTVPGSFLLTVLGWLVTRLPLGLAPAYVLNLFAGLLAALATGLAYLVTLRLIRLANHRDTNPADHSDGVAVVGSALGALTLAFGVTLWQHAVKLTPYVLTVVFTGMILLAMLRWWRDAAEDDAWRWLLVLGVLFGLDFSVHRTNLLLLPPLLVWILLRHPRTLFSWRAWLSGVGGTMAGLAFHLLIIPRAAADPALNFGNPSNWSGFYDYVSLAQYGGGFLVQFFPRHAAFWSVQVWDLVRAIGTNFFNMHGPLGPLGALPGLFGLWGVGLLWRRGGLGRAWLALLFVHAAVTILYFNIPANFFRPFTRHYLPVLLSFAVTVAYGVTATLRRLVELNWGRERITLALSAVLLAVAPLAQLGRNWAMVDGSDHYFTEDYATNALLGAPRDAILFTQGDNDTWPLWYVQAAQGLRPDVDVINLPLTNTDWFVEQLVRRDPSFPIALSAEQRRALAPRHWTDTTLIIPSSGAEATDSIALHVAPTTGGQGVLRQDLIVLQILEDNQWRRPLCFAMTVAPQAYAWLEPYRRLEGLCWRIVLVEHPAPDLTMLRADFLEAYRYRGYADDRVVLDDVTRTMAQQYYVGFVVLGRAANRGGEPASCQEIYDAMVRLLPPRRLEPSIDVEFCH